MGSIRSGRGSLSVARRMRSGSQWRAGLAGGGLLLRRVFIWSTEGSGISGPRRNSAVLRGGCTLSVGCGLSEAQLQGTQSPDSERETVPKQAGPSIPYPRPASGSFPSVTTGQATPQLVCQGRLAEDLPGRLGVGTDPGSARLAPGLLCSPHDVRVAAGTPGATHQLLPLLCSLRPAESWN